MNGSFIDGICPGIQCDDLIHGLPWFASPYFEHYFQPEDLELMKQKIGMTVWKSWVEKLQSHEQKCENSWIGKPLRSWIELGLETSELYFQHYHRQYVRSMLGFVTFLVLSSLITVVCGLTYSPA